MAYKLSTAIDIDERTKQQLLNGGNSTDVMPIIRIGEIYAMKHVARRNAPIATEEAACLNFYDHVH